jgi:NitT/TauT family transport system permease protein
MTAARVSASASRRVALGGDWLPPAVVFVALIAGLEAALRAFDVGAFVVPRPSAIAAALVDQWPTLSRGIAYTGGEAIGGLAVGVVLGTLAGLATARWQSARDTLLPIAIGASTVPIIAFAPITLNWFGPDSIMPRLIIVAVMVFFPVMANTIRGLTDVPPAALELMESYAAGELTTLRKVRVPNALPYWFTALRIAATLSVIGAVVGEFFGGPLYSLGIYITLETGHSRYPTAWAAIVVACVLGIGLYVAAVVAERVAIPWYAARQGAAG